MKNFYYHLLAFFILSLTAYQSKAQNTYKLSPKDDTFTYKKINLLDHDFIKTKNAVNSKTKKDTVLFQKSTTSSMEKSLGSLSVSETGAAIYDIPIEVPQGINDVQPAISINYNSQAGSGIAGTGWNLKGISSIKEMPATVFHGDFIDHTDPDDQYMFALDGNVLFLHSGSVYGGHNVEYKTETYSNIRIKSYGSVLIGGVNRPQYFKVYYPDGSIAEYGRYNSSRSINNYSISYWQNPQGLRINYIYSIDNNSQYLDRITYGNVNNQTSPNEIKFSYNPDQFARTEQSYIKSQNIRRKKLLKSISTWSNGVKIKSYRISYSSQNEPLKYARVNEIYEKNEIDNKILASVVLNYKSYGDEEINKNTITASLNLSGINTTNAIVKTFDWDGNNSLDFIIQPTNPSQNDKFWFFHDINDPYFFGGWQINTGDYEAIFPTTFINHSDKLLSQDALTIVDKGISGTYPVEFKVYVYAPTMPTPNPMAPIYSKTYNVETYNDYYCFNDNPTSEIIKIPQEYLSGDFNGDGLQMF